MVKGNQIRSNMNETDAIIEYEIPRKINRNRIPRNIRTSHTFSLGLGLVKTKPEPEKSPNKAGLVEGSDPVHIARSKL